MADAPPDPLHGDYLALGLGILAVVLPLVVAIIGYAIWREWVNATPEEPELRRNTVEDPDPPRT